MRTLPEITPQEKVFVRNIVAGCSEGEAYECAFPRDASDLPELSKAEIGKKYARKTHIKAWIKYLKDAKPDDMINDLYLAQIAFGGPKDQLNAAEAYAQSNYAGKEVAHIFLDTLQKIQAQILVPCGQHVDKVKI